MTYQESLATLALSSERAVRSLFEQYLAQQITAEQFRDMAATLIVTAQQQGRYLAEVSYMAWQQAAGAEATPVAAPAIAHYADTARIERAIDTVLDKGVLDPDAVQVKLDRLTYSETVESSQRTMNEVLRQAELPMGWVRGLEPGACELCRWWYRGGQVFPKERNMPTHKGCTCTPIPTMKPPTKARPRRAAAARPGAARKPARQQPTGTTTKPTPTPSGE